jgi:magnesium-transporting ATPase (P-type)
VFAVVLTKNNHESPHTGSTVVKNYFFTIDLFSLGRSYKILNVLEFNSARKRMSVVVKNEEGKIFLFTKGADRYVSSVISNRSAGMC